MKKTIRQILAVVICMVLAISASGAALAIDTSNTVKSEETLTVALMAEPTTITGLASNTTEASLVIAECIGGTLLEYDNGKTVPSLASGYEKIDDTHYNILYGNKIYDQIVESGLSNENIYFDPDNTVKDENYFSNNRFKLLNERDGRNLFGITFDSLPVYENLEEENSSVRLK